ncbi:MAG: universal stress protein [Acidimicrobiales bacterium]
MEHVTSPAVMAGAIVVGVDLSDASAEAVAEAGRLARSTAVPLIIAVNVNVPERAAIEQVAEAEQRTFDEAGHEVLRRIGAAHAAEVEVVPVLTHRDSPADGLLDVVADSEASMLVVASHGRSGVQRWLLGSVAEKLARASTVPVLIVPVGERKDRRPEPG